MTDVIIRKKRVRFTFFELNFVIRFDIEVSTYILIFYLALLKDVLHIRKKNVSRSRFTSFELNFVNRFEIEVSSIYLNIDIL